ncbi:alanine--tRNA ligase [Candidatus Uhrbacteria bacterium]|nr:alanine--tRNA ligase [Candidatus Uhrbacteria bacterium]
MNIHEIRSEYLRFFKEKGHAILPSSSLVPNNDPTTLFTGSGMQPMISFLLGEKHPQGNRLADSQKCFRSQDIDEVGDNRHTTFFEMLGNWSLGDYFKQEQIPWMFDFLMGIGLDPKKLYITCFIGDAQFNIPKDVEAGELWKKQFARVGIEAVDAEIGSEQAGYERGMKLGERIFYYDGKKNWWNRGKTGPTTTIVGDPCGPDSEMFYDFGTPHDPKWGKECHPNCDCGRFMEIGNNVFMAYLKKSEDTFVPLNAPNIDHGSGLERIAAAVNNNPDVFALDVFQPFFAQVKNNFGWDYEHATEDQKHTLRIIADHVRATVFLIGDGVLPSNKDQGYFVRRLMRRAIFRAWQFSDGASHLYQSVETFTTAYKETYPDLALKTKEIQNVFEQEEAKFRRTVEKGYRELRSIAEKTKTFTGKNAFDLYQSYGFPLELTIEELQRSFGITVDVEQFQTEFKKHQDLSRAGSEQKFAGGLADHSEATTRLHTATHLLHQTLRMVLGTHVEQKGSNITPERLRFDFSHSEKMTEEQLHEVERMINEIISKNLPVHYEILTLDEAKKRGAIGLFEDKYAQLDGQIKVYFIGEEVLGNYFSKEVCGGPHVERTGMLGSFKIMKEESAASGIRRIKAVLE